jgi:Reverse transcriptase (RNA-dependent DNA polymerase)
MSLPQGFETCDNQVYLLKKSLYGFKQAPCVWHQHLNAYLSQLKFKEVPHSECVFERVSNGTRIRLLVYVDDCLLISKSSTLICAVKSELQRKFQITDLGTATYFLGVEIKVLPQGLFLHQKAYIQEVLTALNMLSCRSSPSPMDPGSLIDLTRLHTTTTTVISPELHSTYRTAIGQLLYLKNETRYCCRGGSACKTSGVSHNDPLDCCQKNSSLSQRNI